MPDKQLAINKGERIKTQVDISLYWKKQQQRVEKALDQSIPKTSVRPQTLHKAMRYSVFAGGKRLRPILCLASADAIASSGTDALILSAAVECIHTYSLIHDDLPCMDDDDLRRGKPTSHKVFGEGIAVLAGDALLTIAFELASRCAGTKRYPAAELVKELAYSSGSQALVAGQVVDLECEGKKITAAQLKYIHEMKTGALITSSIRLGAMSANATARQLKDLSDFGQALGLAFQVVDDILDLTQTSAQLGKSAGKDLKSEKATYPSILGMAKAEKEAARLTTLALSKLKPFGKKAEALEAIAHFMLARKN